MYDSLISEINSYVRANANNEITGNGLNSILLSMINALGTGMSFCGIATINTVPVSNEYPKFYIALVPGAYSNFLNNPPAFKSGFAIIQDDSGSNTWRMSVKAFDTKTDNFLVDAKVEDNRYQAADYFYIKSVTRDNTCTFDVYKTNADNTSEQIVATFSQANLLSGYKTHKVTAANNTIFNIAVNWDKVEIGVITEYTYNDTSFPTTAYISANTDSEATLLELKKRMYVAEYLLGYRLNTQVAENQFSRANTFEFGATFGIVPNTTVVPTLYLPSPNTLDEAYHDGNGLPWELHNNTLGYTGGYAGTQDCIVQLKPSNFPANTESVIYLANNDASNDQPIIIQNLNDDDELISRFTETIPALSILKVNIIRYSDMRRNAKEVMSLKFDLYRVLNT